MKKTTQPRTETLDKFFADKHELDKVRYKQGKKKTIMSEEEFDKIFGDIK